MTRSQKLRLLAIALCPLLPVVFVFWIGCVLVYGLNNPGPKWLLDAATALMEGI